MDPLDPLGFMDKPGFYDKFRYFGCFKSIWIIIHRETVLYFGLLYGFCHHANIKCY